MRARAECRRRDLFETFFACQKSAASKTAIALEVVTAIDDGAHTAAAIATRSNVSERGAQILCDYLTVNGLLAKSDGTYQLVPDAAAFLSKRSLAYLGTVANFLLRPELKNNVVEKLIEAVRRGGVGRHDNNIVSGENLVWVGFAGSMIPAAHAIADRLASSVVKEFVAIRRSSESHSITNLRPFMPVVVFLSHYVAARFPHLSPISTDSAT